MRGIKNRYWLYFAYRIASIVYVNWVFISMAVASRSKSRMGMMMGDYP